MESAPAIGDRDPYRLSGVESANRSRLIYDLGGHDGQDTEFYLKRGFDVVCVEANPVLADVIRRKFPSEIDSGRLVVVEAAIAAHAGKGVFYKFEKDVFSTISPDWQSRNTSMGSKFETIEVQYVTLKDLIERLGSPYYMKIDIEGADMICIDALSALAKPQYLSIEVEKHDMSRFLADTSKLRDLGYSEFQLVQQEHVPFHSPPSPAREGIDVKHRFRFGASGLFGKDLPEDRWLTYDALVSAYEPIVRQHGRFGDYGLGRTWTARQLLRLVRLYPGWHDLHCRLGS